MKNISTKCASCPAHYPVLLWLPYEVLPRDDGYVRLNATKYHDWQVWHMNIRWTDRYSESSNNNMRNGYVNNRRLSSGGHMIDLQESYEEITTSKIMR